ncbi:MAG: site-specific integrase, partial [Clostridiaceae bacterium]
MSTPLKALIDKAIQTLQEANYQESTIYEYRKTFCNLMHVADSLQASCYSYELGEKFRNDTISERTGKCSLYRWKRRNRCVQMFNWFEEHGNFKLDAFIESKIDMPSSDVYNWLLKKYLDSLANEGLKANTIDSFRNVSCKFLQFLELRQYQSIDAAPAGVVYDFIVDIRKTWAEESLRTALSGLRSFLTFAGNEEHYLVAINVRTIKARKIIPILTQKEEDSIWDTLRNNDKITRRDKA